MTTKAEILTENTGFTSGQMNLGRRTVFEDGDLNNGITVDLTGGFKIKVEDKTLGDSNTGAVVEIHSPYSASYQTLTFESEEGAVLKHKTDIQRRGLIMITTTEIARNKSVSIALEANASKQIGLKITHSQ